MNAMKKLFALLLALAMVLSLAVPAMATSAESDDVTYYTIELKDKMDEHTYEAYQVFSGDYHDRILSNVQWGRNFNQANIAAFASALKANAALDEIFGTLSDNPSAAEVASLLAEAELGHDANETQAFADVLHMKDEHGYLFLTGTPLTAAQSTGKDSEDKYTYTFSNVPGGYYLIKDRDGSQEGQDDFYTRLIMQVSGNVTAETKGSVPAVSKSVSNAVNGTFKQSVDISSADEAYFLLEGTLPSNYDKYEDYTYIFVDDMTTTMDIVCPTTNLAEAIVESYVLHNDGTKTPFVIGAGGLSVGGTEDNANGNDVFISYTEDFTQTNPARVSNRLKVKFFNLKTSLPNLLTDDKIVIKYAAKLNGDAVLGLGGTDGNGNENKVALEFSNNPQGDGMGKTKEDTAEVYTYELQIHKVDDSGTHTELAGAEFLLTNRYTEDSTLSNLSPLPGAVQDTVYDYKYPVFERDETNNIYGLAGWFVTDVPIREYEEVLESGVTKRYAVDENGIRVKIKGTNTFVELTNALMISKEGKPIRFQGLDSGTYWLREIREPVGYNILKEPISVSINVTLDPTTGKLVAIKSNVGGVESNGDVAQGIAPATIVNTGGAVLPSTGGIGTTIFYVVGGLLAVAAIVLLITKKRMSEN